MVFLPASDGTSAITVTLNAAVTWRLDFAGGTERTVADLRGGRVAGTTVAAGSDIVDLALPRPRGTVQLLLSGGASQFLLSLPDGVPVGSSPPGARARCRWTARPTPGSAAGRYSPRQAGRQTTPGAPEFDATAGAALVSVTRWGG